MRVLSKLTYLIVAARKAGSKESDGSRRLELARRLPAGLVLEVGGALAVLGRVRALRSSSFRSR